MPPSTTTQQPPHTSSTPRRRIVIVVVGPRGDVQPYCILGQALTARGYDVTIATEARLKALVTAEFGLPFAPIAGDVFGGLFDIEFQHRFRVARSMKCLEMLTEWNDRFNIDDVLASYVSALAGADVVVCGGVLSIAQTYSVAEKHGLKWVPLFLGTCPLPTNEFPHWVLAGVPFGFLCSNHWSHSIVASKGWLQQRKHINKWRRHTLGLPPITSPLGIVHAMQTNDNITIYNASSLLLCGPKRQVPADYPPHKVVYGGFLFPTTTASPPATIPPASTTMANINSSSGSRYNPPPKQQHPGSSTSLQRFLKTRTTLPVIYIGFGEMPTMEPLPLLQLALHVCHAVKCRAVVAASWAEFMPPPSPRLWLFPQMSCIVHHGGFSTTTIALRSGVPQIPCPVIMDQFHHANNMVALGVAPAVVHKGSLYGSYVAKLVTQVLRNDRNIQTTAKDLGKFVNTESFDNTDRFCDWVVAAPPTFASPPSEQQSDGVLVAQRGHDRRMPCPPAGPDTTPALPPLLRTTTHGQHSPADSASATPHSPTVETHLQQPNHTASLEPATHTIATNAAF
ncbi:hypothetical protein H257_10593 [Aphanomyces astaci]|uniref:Uncharacterized protein n=1 Tax=Aphanomyces astaci TaxID=112090 RepID=W4G7Q9_APHAT|nr:hypothetical protein H257_10593 [Aphanomyces astaci]ETV74988.1 hypothetical protein H257_10593 [Aphanomyces astaci]|eukprot:XP_009835492.1 hypothetical protein H257_10593 [Aphanomyces astaci]